MSENYKQHVSVLLDESISALIENKDIEDKHLFADLTFGRGGHSVKLAEQSKNFQLICTDQDPEAYQNGQKIIQEKKLEQQIILEHCNFVNFKKMIEKKHEGLLKERGGFSGILMDLGVSSHHFDSPERGFSFRFDGPLDMRMNIDDQETKTAADIINKCSVSELVEIFNKYGEDPFAQRIAEKIADSRKEKKLETTAELEQIIFHCYPKKMRYGRTHPATKIFQALRLEVNQELTVLSEVIPQLLELLSDAGRLVIISFHSLEDRIVKNLFKENSQKGPYTLITKRPLVPSENEIKNNSRSRSAKLRVIEKNGLFQGRNDNGHKKKER